MEKLIELKECSYDPIGEGRGLARVNFELSAADACALSADLPDDGHLFMRGLASLNAPARGDFYFRGSRLDFSDYRKLLPYKRKIGYITPDSALIGNRSIQENIMLMHDYFSNSHDSRLTGKELELCSRFGLSEKMPLRPAQLDREDFRAVIIVRELSKRPDVLLVERPRDSLGPERFAVFTRILKEEIRTGIALLVLSSDEAFIHEFTNQKFRIENGFFSRERE